MGNGRALLDKKIGFHMTGKFTAKCQEQLE
jgi:hypothetical protein